MINQDAIDIANLADRLTSGYLSHLTAISIAIHPRAKELAPGILPGEMASLGFISRNDARPFEYGFLHHLELIKTDPLIADEMKRVWLSGSLLTLGDALDKAKYFDRAPILELVRHLRNGVAHGNQFNIRKSINFRAHPTHNREFADESEKETILEVTHAQHGKKVLFDFIAGVNVLDVFRHVSSHLAQIGEESVPEPFPGLYEGIEIIEPQ